MWRCNNSELASTEPAHLNHRLDISGSVFFFFFFFFVCSVLLLVLAQLFLFAAVWFSLPSFGGLFEVLINTTVPARHRIERRREREKEKEMEMGGGREREGEKEKEKEMEMGGGRERREREREKGRWERLF